jgi:hypothetical protein
MFNEPKCQVVTPAQVHLFFHDFIQIAGGNHATTALDEAVAFVWTRLVEQLELQRLQGRISYAGATNKLLSLQETRDIFVEFEQYCRHPENTKTLASLVMWLEMQVNGVLEHRQVKVT